MVTGAMEMYIPDGADSGQSAEQQAQPEAQDTVKLAENLHEWVESQLSSLKDEIADGLDKTEISQILLTNSPGNIPSIVAMQAGLKQLGYYEGAQVDGLVGGKTKQAVRGFQEKWNSIHTEDQITVDGVFGKQVAARLAQTLGGPSVDFQRIDSEKGEGQLIVEESLDVAKESPEYREALSTLKDMKDLAADGRSMVASLKKVKRLIEGLNLGSKNKELVEVELLSQIDQPIGGVFNVELGDNPVLYVDDAFGRYREKDAPYIKSLLATNIRRTLEAAAEYDQLDDVRYILGDLNEVSEVRGLEDNLANLMEGLKTSGDGYYVEWDASRGEFLAFKRGMQMNDPESQNNLPVYAAYAYGMIKVGADEDVLVEPYSEDWKKEGDLYVLKNPPPPDLPIAFAETPKQV